MDVVGLKCNAYIEPIQIDEERPVFSWKLESKQNGTAQTAYELHVEEVGPSGRRSVWQTGKVSSAESRYIRYGGEPLQMNTRYSWSVVCWDEHDEMTKPSHSFFETGLQSAGWKAKWIGYDEEVGKPFDKTRIFYCADDFDKGENEYYLPPVPYMRKEFNISKQVESAKLFVSAFGLVEPRLNGKKVGQDYLVPGISNFPKVVFSKAYDVSTMLQEDNVLGLILADGWYAGYMGLNSREWYGSKPRAMVQLEILYTDGTKECVISDEGFKASYGPLLESDIFQGETYDACKELTGWEAIHYDDSAWKPVEIGAEYDLKPTAHVGENVVELDRISPVSITKKADGKVLLDFGKMIIGVLHIKVQGERGTKVSIQHTEQLTKDGELYLRGNRSARAEDSYILKGEGIEEYQPKFTFHGFRYAEVSGATQLQSMEIEAVEISSEIIELSSFSCSSEMVNKILEMIQRTEKNNRMEVPTDCCARDERLGWGMEGNHFIAATAYLNNEERFLRKCLEDIWTGQREDGGLEAIMPPVLMKDIDQYVGDLQSNHGVHMIYLLYKMYGDTDVIRKYYGQIKKYFAFLEQNSDRHIRFATTSDWLGIHTETEHSDLQHGYGDCAPGIIGTGHYAIITNMMIEMMGAIGKEDDREEYIRLHRDMCAAFYLNYIQRDGTLRRGKQGDYLIALAGGLIPEEHEEAAVQTLVQLISQDGTIRWRGGTPTTPYFLPTLRKYHLDQYANAFWTSTTYPSFGYMLKQGATSVWERWDTIFEDGSFHPNPMNAFSHDGLCSTGKDIIGGVLGIDALEPGFKKSLLRPGVTKDITSAKGTYESAYGQIYLDWYVENNKIYIHCIIPANTTARLEIPCATLENVTMQEGKEEQKYLQNGMSVVEVLSGEYKMCGIM